MAQCYADPTYAFETLGWKAELGIERMCEDAWCGQSKNPCGYGVKREVVRRASLAMMCNP